MRFRRRVLGLLLALAATQALAQRRHVETFSVDDGLPATHLFDLAQDTSGRLWIAGRAGITVYDGLAFRTMAPGEGLPNRVFSALDVDARGRVWTVSRIHPQVYYLDGSRWRSLPRAVDEQVRQIWATCLRVLEHRDRRVVVVGTTHGLAVWRGEGWKILGRRNGLPSEHVTSLATVDGEFLVGTTAGMCTLDPRSLECRFVEEGPRLGEHVLALHSWTAGSPSRLWILTRSWLGFLDSEGLTVVVDDFRPEDAGPVIPAGVAVDRIGGVYFGTPARLHYLPPDRGPPLSLGPAEGLASAGATSLLIDREENVWVGGLRGLSRIESLRFLTFDSAHGLLEDEVSAILETSPGRHVLGHDSGLTFLDGHAARTLAFDKRTPGERYTALRVLDLARGHEGEIWAAARTMGVLELTPEPAWSVVADIDVYSVEVDARGRLWALDHHELFARQDGGFSKVDLGFDVGKYTFRWLNSGADGKLYISTSDGLIWWDQRTWHRVHGPTETSNNVYQVLARPSGTVWVATGGGLYELQDRRMVKVARGELEVDRPIYFLLEDRRGRLWLGTDDGVMIWDGETLRQLTVRHGLAGRETNRGAGSIDYRGRVWIGTDQGLSVYQEEYDWPLAVAPGVELGDVEVNGVLRPFLEALLLDHRQNSLTFHVNPIFFSRQEQVVYRYRLEGFDPDWIGPSPLPGLEIRYTNLPPGEYRLRISAGTATGPWSDVVVSNAVTISAPVWRRPWFYALAALVVGLAISGLHLGRTWAIRSRARELSRLNTELVSKNVELERMQAERERLIAELTSKNAELERFSYTVSHDLKSPLVTVRGFLGLLAKDAEAGEAERVRRDIEQIDQAAEKMGRLLDDLLALSRVGRVAGPSEEVSLAELAREAVAATSGALDGAGVEVEIAPDLPVVHADRTRLAEVLQNLVENAVKYMGAQPAPRVEIGARRDRGETVIYVCDNGTGIEPEYHEKIFGLFERLDIATDGTGVGLALVKRIVETHGGRVWVESRGRGHGSTFCFTLPG